MEETLTLDELYLLRESLYRTEHRHNKFMAAIQGIDIDKDETDPRFDDVAIRAQAELAGKTEDEFVFDMIGIEIEDDDE